MHCTALIRDARIQLVLYLVRTHSARICVRQPDSVLQASRTCRYGTWVILLLIFYLPDLFSSFYPLSIFLWLCTPHHTTPHHTTPHHTTPHHTTHHISLGVEVTARMEVVSMEERRSGLLVVCSTQCRLSDGCVAVDGEAKVLIPRVK